MNIGVLGSGSIVRVFIRKAAEDAQYHLRAVWGRHPERLKEIEGFFDYSTCELDKILHDPKIEAIYIALPNSLHYSYARKALEAGKHVLVEKPFTVRYKEAAELVRIAREKGLVALEAAPMRYHPLYHKMKEFVSATGRVRIVHANFSQYSRRYDRFKKGEVLPVFDPALAGGALLDLNVYNIHFTAGMFGMPQSVRYFPNMDHGVDTSGVLVLDYGDFNASLIAAKDCKGNNFACVEGDEGTLTMHSAASRCAAFTFVPSEGETVTMQDTDDEFSGFGYELKEFARLVKENDREAMDACDQETLITAMILDQALQSAQIPYISQS